MEELIQTKVIETKNPKVSCIGISLQDDMMTGKSTWSIPWPNNKDMELYQPSKSIQVLVLAFVPVSINEFWMKMGWTQSFYTIDI